MSILAQAVHRAAYKTVDLSLNAKTGPMAAVYASKDSCPPTCALYAECYAKQGHTNIHFDAASNGVGFDALLKWVRELPLKMWRYGVAGDLPGDGVTLDRAAILALAKANRKRAVLAYTHYKPTPENIETIQAANAAGFALNVSCDTVEDIKAARAAGVPAVTYTDSTDTRKAWTDDGIKYQVCPNQASKAKPQCIDCKLCSKSKREQIVVFRAHGSRKGSVGGVV